MRLAVGFPPRGWLPGSCGSGAVGRGASGQLVWVCGCSPMLRPFCRHAGSRAVLVRGAGRAGLKDVLRDSSGWVPVVGKHCGSACVSHVRDPQADHSEGLAPSPGPGCRESVF